MGILKKLFTAENLLHLGLIASCLAIVLLSPSEKFNDIVPVLGMSALGSGLFLSLVSYTSGVKIGKKFGAETSYIQGYHKGFQDSKTFHPQDSES